MKYYININNEIKLDEIIEKNKRGELGNVWEAQNKVRSAWFAYAKVYAETAEIRKDFESNPDTVWFPLYRAYDINDGDFDSEEKAFEAYISNRALEEY